MLLIIKMCKYSNQPKMPFMELELFALLILCTVSTLCNTSVPSAEMSRQMREYKTEAIRTRILSELPDPPTGIVPPQHIPQSVISLLAQKRVEESLLAEGKNHIAYPTNANTHCWNESTCSRYDFQLPFEDKPFSSMHVWLPKTTSSGPRVSISACFITSSDDICDTYTTLTEITSEDGGSIFEIPGVMLEQRGDQQFCTIEILGLPPSTLHPDLKPILVSHFQSDPARKRRSTANSTPTSDSNCTCCLLKLEVNFTAIGLPWVVAPPTFNPNMCYGHCTVQLNNYPSHYHRMISTMKQSNPQMPSAAERNLWTPCCSPTKLSPFSMIYMAAKKDNGTEEETGRNETISFFYHKIPDMITESCGCW